MLAGKQPEAKLDVAVGVEVKTAPTAAEPWVTSLGVIDRGLELMRLAWPSLRHVFSVRRNEVKLPSPMETPTEPKVFQGVHRYSPILLNQQPVDLLVVDRGSQYQPPAHHGRTPWEVLVAATQPDRKSRLVIETWPASAQMWIKGPMSKARTTIWRELGYDTRCKVIRATDVGGAIRQDRLLVARVHLQWTHLWKWDATEGASEVVRPMSNLLTPPGLVPTNLYDRTSTRNPPDARTDPMPEQAGAWIRTEKGVRRVSLDETSRGLGLPKEMVVHLTPSLLRNTTSLFHFEYLSPSLVSPVAEPLFKANLHSPDDLEATKSQSRPVFLWNPPDLSEGSTWYNDRVHSLRVAVSTLPDAATAFDDGLELLRIHRGNYTATGPAPKRLQLLWWEFPPGHWTPFREGSPMNFLVEPVPRLNPNAHMDPEQLVVAAGFVDELLELSVLLSFAEGKAFLMNAPLFVVPKEGQEGEWRVIAEMCLGPTATGLDFRKPVFDPALGYGFILESTDGSPAVKIWVWVDDFILHGPSFEKTTQALKFFLDTTVRCGMLCHPRKLIPPSQVVKCCGFLFDTTTIPCLRIPVPKRERALAIVQHLLAAPLSKRWSRLSLAVAAGILKSLVDATPRRLGHTYLRRFQRR